MIKAEIISNQSVMDDVIEALENKIPEIEYTIIPGVQGKGLHSKKLGDTIWPELNFYLFSFIADEKVDAVKEIMKALKTKFPKEGISDFYIKVE